MKFSHKILIDLPREEVINKMEDPANYKHWQRGFISYKHLSGLEGKEGSRSKLKFQMGKRVIEMIETIGKRVYPKKFHATYEAPGVFNIQMNYFEVEPDNKTLWIADSEFQFSGFMKLIGTFMPGSFKKQSWQFMQDFKSFAEEGKSVLHKNN